MSCILTELSITCFCVENNRIIWNFFNGRLFFFGTNEKKMPGSLRVSKYPFSGEEILDLQSHAKGIKKIKITIVGLFLINPLNSRVFSIFLIDFVFFLYLL